MGELLNEKIGLPLLKQHLSSLSKDSRERIVLDLRWRSENSQEEIHGNRNSKSP